MQEKIDEKVFYLPFHSKALFKERINRFTGVVDIFYPERINDVKIHIHDSGRLGEILFKGNTVYLRKADNPNRKTKWDLIAGETEGGTVFVNSMYHRRISTWLIREKEFLGKVLQFKPEFKFGNSRIDYFVKTVEVNYLVEIKGCTLAENGIALFPDAPTERGRRHLEELMKALDQGYRSAVIFLVFRNDAMCFLPHIKRDPAFSETFFKALEKGVEAYYPHFTYDGEWVRFTGTIPLCK
jgi:sugar fermentation stimulation protein A